MVSSLRRVSHPSALSPPQRLLHWGNGEKTGKERDNGEINVPRALSFPFSPAPARFNSPLPIPDPTERRKRPLRRREILVWNRDEIGFWRATRPNLPAVHLPVRSDHSLKTSFPTRRETRQKPSWIHTGFQVEIREKLAPKRLEVVRKQSIGGIHFPTDWFSVPLFNSFFRFSFLEKRSKDSFMV